MVASCPDGHSNSLRFGIFERKCNVILGMRLDDQPRVHVVIYLVAGRRILVIRILISLCPPLWELVTCYTGDSGHDVQLILSGAPRVEIQIFKILYTYSRQISSD